MSRIALTAALAGVITVAYSAPAHAFQVRAVFSDNVVSWYLDAGQLNGKFDTINFKFDATQPSQLINPSSGQVAGVPRLPGEPFTYINRVLNFDPLDGGRGWSILGLVINATEVSWAGGPLGSKMDTSSEPGGELFLVNAAFNRSAGLDVGTGRISFSMLARSCSKPVCSRFQSRQAQSSASERCSDWCLCAGQRRDGRLEGLNALDADAAGAVTPALASYTAGMALPSS